jgi:hypothetical protein
MAMTPGPWTTERDGAALHVLSVQPDGITVVAVCKRADDAHAIAALPVIVAALRNIAQATRTTRARGIALEALDRIRDWT